MRSSSVMTFGIILVSLLAAGCGGGSSGAEIGCEWFAGENCYKASLVSAAGCLPDRTETGVLSADGASCSYASCSR